MTPMPPDHLRNLLRSVIPLPLEMEPPKILKLWKIPERLKCPLIGTCLSIEEHRLLLKKAGVSVRRMSAPELHEAVMGNVDSPTRIARRLEAFFEKKFKKEAQDWLEKPETELRELWKKGLITGEIELPLYLIACRSNISSGLHMLHMLGHTAKRMLLESRKTVTRLETALAEEQEKLRDLQKHEKERHASSLHEISSLNQKLMEQAALLEQQGKRPLRSPEESLKDLKQKLQRLEEKNGTLAERMHRLEKEREELRKQLAEQPAKKAEKEEEKKQFQESSMEPFSLQKPAVDLGRLRILVVGGRPCMQPFYKDVVESAGGSFEYHDGCVHGGKTALKNHIRRCDFVLCPVDCNSHGACGFVKNACRKYGKCLRMLHSSSRSAIHLALENLCSNCSLNKDTTPVPLIASNKHQAKKIHPESFFGVFPN